MKKNDSGRTASARNDGSVSRALTSNPATSPNSNSNSNIEALPFRVFLDGPISNGGRKWRMLAALFLEFSVVAGVIALPVWFAQRPDHVVPTEGQPYIEIYIPKGDPGAKHGSRGGGSSEAPVPTSNPKPNFDRGDRLLYRTDIASASQPRSGEGDDWRPSDGASGWGHRDGIEGGTGVIVPIGDPPQPQPPPERYRVGGKVDFPVQLRRVEPRYPPIARQAGIQGDVILKVLLSKRGEIEAVIVSSGNPLLAPAAKRAVERWKYAPALLNGHPVAVDMDVVVRFYIRQ